MYPVRLGYSLAIKRINELISNGHHAESLVTSVFTVEKTLRRTFRQLVISSGFNSKYADRVLKLFKGIDSLMKAWDIFDPKHRKLSEILSSDDYRVIKEASNKRNKIIHGEQVLTKEVCKIETQKVLVTLDNVKNKLDLEYGYSGWSLIKSRIKSRLHIDPKVLIE